MHGAQQPELSFAKADLVVATADCQACQPETLSPEKTHLPPGGRLITLEPSTLDRAAIHLD